MHENLQPDVSRVTRSTEETEALGVGVAHCAKGGDVVLLSGELGAGKTAFVRGVAKGLGIGASVVSSPTFVIMNVYEVPEIKGGSSTTVSSGYSSSGQGSIEHGIRRIVHMDAYRMSGGEELENVGWDRVFDETAGRAREGVLLLVEWPKRIADVLGTGVGDDEASERVLRVKLSHRGPDQVGLVDGTFGGIFDPELLSLRGEMVGSVGDGGSGGGVRGVGDGCTRRIEMWLGRAWQSRADIDLLLSRPPIQCPKTKAWVAPTGKSYPFANERARGADLFDWLVPPRVEDEEDLS